MYFFFDCPLPQVIKRIEVKKQVRITETTLKLAIQKIRETTSSSIIFVSSRRQIEDSDMPKVKSLFAELFASMKDAGEITRYAISIFLH